MLSRRARFFFLEKLLLPIAILPLRVLIKSWRIRVPDATKISQIGLTERVVLGTYHGTLFHLLAYASLLLPYRRRIVVMTSPSYDGRLLAALLRRLGIDSVRGSSRSRSVGGTKEFIRKIRAGNIGLIAVDGPRGPRCVVKPGFLKIAAVARAHMLLAATTASHGFTFGTWDRAHVPAPFARVEIALKLLAPPEAQDAERQLPSVAETLRSMAEKIASPVVREHPQPSPPKAA